ncbi:YccV-like-domain-containing protein [Aspergillus saccharolyticus JOP 1030-1]|uniref:YccV-like-domain-containing protein n=1 Tax=Aspergillus saccharolyticus JOP 1030-1 TaxID=1450539 RepID=A0A318ZCE5_9EURO|nr:YccV-like-domain-containing protein [Aspergillus saccharolyticus JOP 1030-1]PYH41160.1 YccV-like-domain-containing protein [Aspergillus saccharolyticus JOP 1030-1]
MVLSLDCLPEELLQHILHYCQPYTTATLEQTARRFRGVTNEPALWRHYCLSNFEFWAPEHELPRRLAAPISGTDWKRLYILKHTSYRATSRLLDSIICSQVGRIQKFQAITDLGFDAKDALSHNLLVRSKADDQLARRYYAGAVLSCLHRSFAIREWAKLRSGEQVSLSRALAAFDLFICESGFGSLEEVISRLDQIIPMLVANYPEVHLKTSRDKARTIARFLRANNLTGIEPGRGYHCLDHNFIGVSLKDPSHNSLPLVSAAIYCHVAQGLGLDARPCGFPFHVHVIVTPPVGFDIDDQEVEAGTRGPPIYMDPFRSDEETPVADLQHQLNFLGASAAEEAMFLGDSEISEIVLRCSKNILNSLQRGSNSRHARSASVDLVSAKYAALWSYILLSDPARPIELRQNLPWLMELLAMEFPADINMVEQFITPLFDGTAEYNHILESLHVMRAVDSIPREIKRRSPQDDRVKYRIGQVCRHRRYAYSAIITGWDVECGAGEQWMRRMEVDRLQDGRHQSFYRVLVDDRSVRYVAEENIEPIITELMDLPHTLVAIAGRYFKRWDSNRRVFVSNIKDEYPDD